MSVHEQIIEDLPLYALGELEGEERSALESHLEGCTACRNELEAVRGDLAMLAFSVSGPEPPLRSRQRLLDAISKEPRGSRAGQTVAGARRNWWRVLELVAAAAAVAFVLFAVRENKNMQRGMVDLQANSANQQQQLLQANELLTSLTSTEAEHFTLVAAKTPPQPQGRAIYVRRNGTLVFLATNMTPLPAQKIYELWLIPKTGAPIPVGLFTPNSDGSATIVKPQIPAGVEAKTFAITIEPREGSPAPTSQPIMAAAPTA